MPGVRYQRKWLTQTWIAAFGLFPAGTGVAGAVYSCGLVSGWGGWNPVVLSCWLAWALVGVVAGIRSAQVCVAATPEHLVIRNFLTTSRIPWTDIRAIERPRPFIHAGRWSGLYNPGNGLRVLLRNGQVRSASAFSPAGWDAPEFADPVIEELR